MTDVTVSYQLPSGLTAQHAPKAIPAVFNNEKLVLYAVLRKSRASVTVSGEGVAKLQGSLLGKKLEYCVEFKSRCCRREVPLWSHCEHHTVTASQPTEGTPVLGETTR